MIAFVERVDGCQLFSIADGLAPATVRRVAFDKYCQQAAMDALQALTLLQHPVFKLHTARLNSTLLNTARLNPALQRESLHKLSPIEAIGFFCPCQRAMAVILMRLILQALFRQLQKLTHIAMDAHEIERNRIARSDDQVGCIGWCQRLAQLKERHAQPVACHGLCFVGPEQKGEPITRDSTLCQQQICQYCNWLATGQVERALSKRKIRGTQKVDIKVGQSIHGSGEHKDSRIDR